MIDFLLIVFLLALFTLTAIAAAKVKILREEKFIAERKKQQAYRQMIYGYIEICKAKAKSKRQLPRGRVKVPSIAAMNARSQN
jgi:hypothetical protein